MDIDAKSRSIGRRPLVIGIGNALRSDDAIGPKIIQKLKRQSIDADFLEVGGDATCLLQAWRYRTHVIAIDAAEMNEQPGAIRRIDVACDELPRINAVSSHGFGLAQAIELARALNQLPPHFVVFAIQGETFSQGHRLSPALKAAVPQVEKRLLDELRVLRLEDAG